MSEVILYVLLASVFAFTLGYACSNNAAEKRKKNLIQFMRGIEREFMKRGKVSESVAIGIMADNTHNQL